MPPGRPAARRSPYPRPDSGRIRAIDAPGARGAALLAPGVWLVLVMVLQQVKDCAAVAECAQVRLGERDALAVGRLRQRPVAQPRLLLGRDAVILTVGDAYAPPVGLRQFQFVTLGGAVQRPFLQRRVVGEHHRGGGQGGRDVGVCVRVGRPRLALHSYRQCRRGGRLAGNSPGGHQHGSSRTVRCYRSCTSTTSAWAKLVFLEGDPARRCARAACAPRPERAGAGRAADPARAVRAHAPGAAHQQRRQKRGAQLRRRAQRRIGSRRRLPAALSHVGQCSHVTLPTLMQGPLAALPGGGYFRNSSTTGTGVSGCSTGSSSTTVSAGIPSTRWWCSLTACIGTSEASFSNCA